MEFDCSAAGTLVLATSRGFACPTWTQTPPKMKMTTAIPAGMAAPIEAAVRLSASCGSGLPTLRRSVTANGEGLSPSRLAPAAGQRAFRSAIGGILDQLEYPVDDTGVVADVPVEGRRSGG